MIHVGGVAIDPRWIVGMLPVVLLISFLAHRDKRRP